MWRRVRTLVHLATRFVGSLCAPEPDAAAVAQVRAVLSHAEFNLWQSMPRADRAESLATLRRVPTDIARVDSWAAAALLHDVGKAQSGLGTWGRTRATVRGVFGDPAAVSGAAGLYLRHAEIGASTLEAAGARPEAVAWARAHHDESRWPLELVPRVVCEALARADGETDDFRTPEPI